MLRASRALAAPAALVLLLSAAKPAHADFAPKWSDAQLVGLSEVILTGTVTSVVSAFESGAIYTYVTLDVGEVVKGWIPEREITLKQLGGQAGGLALSVSGQPTFAPGEEVLVFLEVRPRDSTLYTAALWQGKWSISADSASGQRLATRLGPYRAASRGIFTGAPESRLLAAFLAQIEVLAGAESRRPGRFVNVAPREAPLPLEDAQAPFAFLGPARWFDPDNDLPVLVNFPASAHPGTPGGGDLVRAATDWIAAGSRVQLGAGSAISPKCSNPFTNNGRINLAYVDPCGEISDAGGTLAIGGGWFTSATFGVVNGQPFRKFLEGFVVTNNSATALTFLTTPGCFYEIMSHELGHALGLGHSGDPSARMFPTVSFAACSAGGRPLGADDVSGILFVYPRPGAAPPAAPSNLTATVGAGRTVTLAWTAPNTGGAPTTYTIEAGSGPGLRNLANFSTGSTATSFSAPNVPAGTYFARVKAGNSTGVSPASNEVVIVVP